MRQKLEREQKTGREGSPDYQKERAAQEGGDDEMRIEDNYGQVSRKGRGKHRRGIINKAAGPQQAIFGGCGRL
jgi:hypothetical protein